MAESIEQQILEEQFNLGNKRLRFSNLNLPSQISCDLPKENKCPTTIGLDNSHTEFFALILSDNIFRDFFNVFLLLPIHSHQCVVKQSNEGCYFECFPMLRNIGKQLSVNHMLEWLYANRLPFFLTSRIYQVCLFAHAFCSNNAYMDFDEEIEYTKKELVMFAEMHTVEGIQKLIRHAGSTADGIMIQLWLDLQWLQHTKKEHGHMDMVKAIRERYTSQSIKLPKYFKGKLSTVLDEICKISLNSCQLTRKKNFMNSYEILLYNPFIQKGFEDGHPENVKYPESLLSNIQGDLMKYLKEDFCKRYLAYYECLPSKYRTFTKETPKNISIIQESSLHSQKADRPCDLKAGRSKSTLPQTISCEMQPDESVKRPKTCYPHLHPKMQSISRLSAKTSGYLSLTPEDRLVSLSPQMIENPAKSIRKVLSLPNLSSMQHSEAALTSHSMIDLSETSHFNVNENAVKKCKEAISNHRHRGTESQLSNHSMSLDVSLSQASETVTTRSPDINLSAGDSKHKFIDSSKMEKDILPPIVRRATLASSPQSKEAGHPPSAKNHGSIILNKDLSTSVRRNTTFQNVMDSRRASSFIGRTAGSQTQRNSSFNLQNNVENQKVSDEIVQNKNAESMLIQDKQRFYVAMIASDQLAGGPFRNYLETNHLDALTNLLTLWENIEVVRCLTNEGGRRGAIAKSFGGNGFISSYDDWPVAKDDPYHQYQESLRQIRRYPDPWHDFMQKMHHVEKFFMNHKIVKPYDLGEINGFVEKLTESKCDDEILALVQEYVISKLRKHIDKYLKFDTSNFQHYLSEGDITFSHRNGKYLNEGDKFLINCHSRMKGRPSIHYDLFRIAVFSPLSGRLWVAIDMCERMVFPFAVRKLSMPMMTLGSMIQVKMFVMRKRKQMENKKREAATAAVGFLEKEPIRIPKRKEPYFPRTRRKQRKVKNSVNYSYSIDWNTLLPKLENVYAENYNSITAQVTKNIGSLAPPTFEDLLLQESSLKAFRRYINMHCKYPEKEHLTNVMNFLVAVKDIDSKLDSKDFCDWSKGIFSSFIFCKHSILQEMHLDEEISIHISKKRIGNPSFLLNISHIVKQWVYTNIWKDFTSKMYPTASIDYELFFKAKQVLYWKPQVLKKPLCKRILQQMVNISNFILFISEPSQFESFRQFLAAEKDASGVEKSLIGKKNNIPIWISKLPQDLYLLMDIMSYKNLILSIRGSAQDLTLDDNEEKRIFQKTELIQESFFDSLIPPRLQVNVPTTIATDISISLKNHHFPYSLFNEGAIYILLTLTTYWRKYCLLEFAPDSNKKDFIVKRLSGIPLTYQSTHDNHWNRNTQLFSNSVASKFSLSRGYEITGLYFTVSNGFKEVLRPINTFARPSNSSCKRSTQSVVGEKSSKQSFKSRNSSLALPTTVRNIFNPRIGSRNFRSSIVADIRRK